MQQSTRRRDWGKRRTVAAAIGGIAAVAAAVGIAVTLPGPAPTAGSADVASAGTTPPAGFAPIPGLTPLRLRPVRLGPVPLRPVPLGPVPLRPVRLGPVRLRRVPRSTPMPRPAAGGQARPGESRARGEVHPARSPARADHVPPGDVGGRRLASHGIVVAPGAMPLPPIPASAYVIANADTGKVLAARDPHGTYPPASTLKVLTAITMLPRLHPNATITATRLAASVVPNIVGLIPGHRYKVADLFRALLLISANDAAVSLVQASGSFAHGMALLNAEAHHLQAYDVVAKQPNGLPAPGQVVSAYDLALIARQALASPAFMRYDSTLSASFPVSRGSYLPMVNQNALLTQYPGALGGKIGWTMRAGATYIGLARRNGVTLIVTILHATPLTEIGSAMQLLNWGFAMNGRAHSVGMLVRPVR
jgi:D-alanyl-D-alanine carboxypeptidase (penicillin-binding protein 5/6)